ncbi:MAG: hypothetical protein ABSG32_20260 [Terriglobia bacterium]
MNDKEKLFVEKLIDASLRHYTGAEPRSGLEDRVLAGVRARQKAARRRKAWAWAMGVAAVAAMLTLLVIQWQHQQPAPSPVTAKASANLSAPALARIAPPVPPPMPHRPRRPAAPSRVDTRPQQFPTPRPLSEQEKLLVVYAQLLKNSSGAAVPKADQVPERDLEIPPISIAAIKIEPLAPPENIGDEK